MPPSTEETDDELYSSGRSSDPDHYAYPDDEYSGDGYPDEELDGYDEHDDVGLSQGPPVAGHHRAQVEEVYPLDREIEISNAQRLELKIPFGMKITERKLRRFREREREAIEKEKEERHLEEQNRKGKRG